MKQIISVNGKFLTLRKESGNQIIHYPSNMFKKLLSELRPDDLTKEEVKLVREVSQQYNKLSKIQYWNITRALPSQQKATALTMEEINELKSHIVYFKEFKDKLKMVNKLVNKFFPGASGVYKYGAYGYDDLQNIRLATVPLVQYYEHLDNFILIAHNEAKQKTQHKSYALYFETAVIQKTDESRKGFISARNSSLTSPTVLASAKLFETPKEVKQFAKVKHIDKFAVVEVDVKMKTILEAHNTDAAEISSVIEKELVEDILIPSAENKKLTKMLQIIKEHQLEHLLNDEEKTVAVRKKHKI